MKNYTYNFNPQGQLLARHELLGGVNLRDTFVYDNLNRLNRFNTADTVLYDANANITNGNISYKSDAGTFNYQATPYALTQVTHAKATMLNDSTQDVTYTAFDKVATISAGFAPAFANMTFTYGADHQRIKTVLTQMGQNTITKYILFGNFERIVQGTTTTERCYVSAGEGVCAVVEKISGVSRTYFVHKDNLGSWNVITDSTGAVVQRASFDAWGKMRNPSNWTYTGNNYTLRFDRGYTGHEHIQAFNLINMNGRMYDPAVGRFLSPDIFADAGSTQGMNSYSYCLNNPLMYSDPSGWIATNIGLGGGIQNSFGYDTAPLDRYSFLGGSCGSGGGWDFIDWTNGATNAADDYAFAVADAEGGVGSNLAGRVSNQIAAAAAKAGLSASEINRVLVGESAYRKAYWNNLINNENQQLFENQQKQQQQFENQQKLAAAQNIGYGDNYSPEQSLDDLLGDGGDRRVISFNFNMPAVLLVAGISGYASYNVNGTIIIDGSDIIVTAIGTIIAGNIGDVSFAGRAQLVVNGSITSTQNFTLPSSYLAETGTYPLGSASFTVPDNSNIQIIITAGYVLQTGAGLAVPYPANIIQTINIPLYNSSNR